MPLEKSLNSFTGQNGEKRLNCAQSVINGFRAEFSVPEKTVQEFAAFGGGRAPEGVCGAFYAAKTMLEKSGDVAGAKELQTIFEQSAGSLVCREIRANRRLSCRGCVETCARVLDTVKSAE